MLCSKCGYPAKSATYGEDDEAFYVPHVGCPEVPAHVELTRLKAQIAEYQKRLDDLHSEAKEKAGYKTLSRKTYDEQMLWTIRQLALHDALSLLRQAAAGKLEIKKEG